MKTLTPAEIETLAAAMKILEERALYVGAQFEVSRPQVVKDYCRFWLSTEERELFCCIWLDSQNRVLEKEVLFAGTLSQTSVYPREVVKTALAHNAASVILVHNHPSGICEPSQADRNLTNHLKRALELVDVRVLDHMIVGCGEVYSFAEKGLI